MYIYMYKLIKIYKLYKHIINYNYMSYMYIHIYAYIIYIYIYDRKIVKLIVVNLIVISS